MSFVRASRNPIVGPNPDWGRAGLLMSNATDIQDGVRDAGIYAAKLLSGAKPGDLPVEQASKFTLLINQKTAKSASRADEVIEWIAQHGRCYHAGVPERIRPDLALLKRRQADAIERGAPESHCNHIV
jgi:hypothetical protein